MNDWNFLKTKLQMNLLTCGMSQASDIVTAFYWAYVKRIFKLSHSIPLKFFTVSQLFCNWAGNDNIANTSNISVSS